MKVPDPGELRNHEVCLYFSQVRAQLQVHRKAERSQKEGDAHLTQE